MLCDTGMQLQCMAWIGALEKEQGNPGTEKSLLRFRPESQGKIQKIVKIAPFSVSFQKRGQRQQNLTAAWPEGAMMESGEGEYLIKGIVILPNSSMTNMSAFLESLYPGHRPCLTRTPSLDSGQRIHSLDQEFSVNGPFRPGTQATSINHLPSGAQPALLHHAVKLCFPHKGLLPTLGEMEFPLRASGVSTKIQLGLLKRISGQSTDKQCHQVYSLGERRRVRGGHQDSNYPS